MKVGSLFSGYGGLDMAVQAITGASLAWVCDVEPASRKILEIHHPNIPNIGDVTTVNWDAVEHVDILTAGYPCQPFSTAGNRKGSNDERHLWPYVKTAIGEMGPRLVFLENVAGHLSLGFAAVIGGLATLGYDARWGIVRASDAGAPHQRKRLFVVAYPNSAESRSIETPDTKGSEWRGTQSEYLCAAIGQTAEPRERSSVNWGKYERAIRHWENLTRPVPNPTIQHNGKPRLNPVFVEWMMGLPEGWVTGHDLTTAQCLKILGNGVVPQQALLAYRMLL